MLDLGGRTHTGKRFDSRPDPPEWCLRCGGAMEFRGCVGSYSCLVRNRKVRMWLWRCRDCGWTSCVDEDNLLWRETTEGSDPFDA